MIGQWAGARTVVPDNSVTEIVDAESQNYPRLEEAWLALHWLLSRSGDRLGLPARGDENLRLYVQSDDPIAGLPAIWVVYRVTEDQIQIVAVHFEPPLADEDQE